MELLVIAALVLVLAVIFFTVGKNKTEAKVQAPVTQVNSETAKSSTAAKPASKTAAKKTAAPRVAIATARAKKSSTTAKSAARPAAKSTAKRASTAKKA